MRNFKNLEIENQDWQKEAFLLISKIEVEELLLLIFKYIFLVNFPGFFWIYR